MILLKAAGFDWQRNNKKARQRTGGLKEYQQIRSEERRQS
jgi:hypothetical protein